MVASKWCTSLTYQKIRRLYLASITTTYMVPRLIVFFLACSEYTIHCKKIILHLSSLFETTHFVELNVKIPSGVFVVEDAVSHPLPSYIASTPQTSEQFLLLSESHVSEDKTPVDFIDIVMAFNWKHVTNGRLSPTMTFKRNERVHFRAVNAGVEPAVALSIENHKLILYAMDGYPVPEPKELDSVTLDAGVRAEFFVKFDTPGTFQFKRGPWNMGIRGAEMCVAVFGIDADKCISYDEERDVGTIVVLDEEVESDLTVDDPIAIPAKTRSSSKPAMDPYLKNLLKLPKAGSREITL